jgi:hypothetical protein
MSGYLGLPDNFIEALEALEFGETLPILQKKATSRRTGLTEFRAKLTAIAYIEYQYVKGVKKYVSTDIVADKFAVSRDVVKDWPVEVRAALGNLEVQRKISRAQNSARNYLAEASQPDAWANELPEYYEENYGLHSWRPPPDTKNGNPVWLTVEKLGRTQFDPEVFWDLR